ncbi:MAG: M15 family metallopeptidase [Dactylosporangium sp.]|nr:M15 family metallopeptidase [Dactylosporangium sp.]NNJ59421.1 M15 family metallopeptidase [Dactylosporangium sp.]
MAGGPGRTAGLLLTGLVTCCALGACSGVAGDPRAGAPSGAPTGPVATPSPSVTRIGAATPAPEWLGTRVLPVGSDGFAAAQDTPPELRERSIITVDDLPPPSDGRFHATIQTVPASVLARSTWTSNCPVAQPDLRYLTVGFRGFDGRAHTGELLVHARVADDIVTVFERLFAAGFPIERMRVTSTAELNAPPTGDGNPTGGFACRPVRGQTSWSQHAYGLAVDIDPFQNPYHKGHVVLPELATAYLDRAEPRAGMVLPDGPVVRAFAAIGWRWGGNYRSLKDYMHFSANGG